MKVQVSSKDCKGRNKDAYREKADLVRGLMLVGRSDSVEPKVLW
jgi:hypothetical protein